MGGFQDPASIRQSSIVNRHSQTPAVAAAFVFSVGIAFSLICREYSFAGLVAGNLFLIIAAFLALRQDRLYLSLTIGLAAIAICGFLMGLAARDGYSGSDLRSHLARRSFPTNEPVSFEGCVVKESELRGDDSITTIDLTAFFQKDRWISCKGEGILKIAEQGKENSPQAGLDLLRGDRVRGWAIWNTPRNYENPGSADNAGLLIRRGIFLIGRAKSFRLIEVIPGGCTNPWNAVANAVGMRVRKSLEPIRDKEGGQPAAILASLVIGDYSGLDSRTREIFQNSGTFHVLVVSGLHVAWIAGLILQFCKIIYVPDRIRYLLAFIVILLYTCIVGFQASMTRCLWMFLLYLIGRMIFRRATSLNIILASALVLLIARPCWLFETGFQLSFLSVMAIAMTAAPAFNNCLKPLCEPLQNVGNRDRLFLQAGRWHRCGRKLSTVCELFIETIADRWFPAASRILLWIMRRIGSAGLALVSMILTSVAVQIWLSPLLACCFNRISWISVISNLVIVPFSSIVLGFGIAGLLLASIPLIGSMVVQISGMLASILLSCAARSTALPGAWQRCPTPSPAWVLAAFLLLLFWSLLEWRRFWVPCSTMAIMMACLSYGSVPVIGPLIVEFRRSVIHPEEKAWAKNVPILSFTFLDVGEGDSAVIRFPDSRVWVLDAGGIRQPHSHEDSAYSFDIGEAVVSRYLWHEWIGKIDRLILSHPDIDHAGGVPAVMKNFRIGSFEYSQAGSDAILDTIAGIALDRRIPARQPHAGFEERIGPVKMRVLNPPANTLFSSTNENSLVLEFSYREFSALLTGDLEKSGEAGLLSRSDDLHCRLLKVAHHGSRWGTSNYLLDRIDSRWAVISVGRNNPFGHPSKEALSRLLQHNVRSFLTLDHGAITFETDGTRYLIKSHINGVLDRGDL
jgi:competence protein ComEC